MHMDPRRFLGEAHGATEKPTAIGTKGNARLTGKPDHTRLRTTSPGSSCGKLPIRLTGRPGTHGYHRSSKKKAFGGVVTGLALVKRKMSATFPRSKACNSAFVHKRIASRRRSLPVTTATVMLSVSNRVLYG